MEKDDGPILRRELGEASLDRSGFSDTSERARRPRKLPQAALAAIR